MKRKPADDIDNSFVPEEFRLRMQTEHGDWYGFRMTTIGNFFSYEPFALIYKLYGIVPDDYTILANLNDWGGMTAKVICTLTGRPKNSISRAAIKLTRDGLIQAEADSEDRRRTILTITASGRALCEELAAICRVYEEKMFGALSKKELESLDAILLKLLKGWSHEFGGDSRRRRARALKAEEMALKVRKEREAKLRESASAAKAQ